jgi:hypothetical protein
MGKPIPEGTRKGWSAPVKLALFQELVELNQAFDRVLQGLERMERVRLFRRDIVRYARAEVESARVDANREFFDKFDQIVEQDARWAYEFQRDYDGTSADVEDLYLEIKEREEGRKKKGLPPRLAILPNWVRHDEEQYDEERARKRKRRTTQKKRRRHSRPLNPPPTGVASTPDGELER